MIDARRYVTNPQGAWGPIGRVIGYAVHHSVTTISPAASEAQELAHIKAIDTYHVNIEYGGFGYHLAAFPSGRSYLCGEGQRAHVKGRNHELYGIVAIGDFSNRLPAEPQIQALRDCVAFAAQTYGVLPVKGHNEWARPGEGTVCAGKLNGHGWTLVPAPAPNLTTAELAHAGPFLYAAFFRQDKSLLHPYDAGRIEAALAWWRG